MVPNNLKNGNGTNGSVERNAEFPVLNSRRNCRANLEEKKGLYPNEGTFI